MLASSLGREFSNHWGTPLYIMKTGESDLVTFLRKWPHKIQVVGDLLLSIQIAARLRKSRKRSL